MAVDPGPVSDPASSDGEWMDDQVFPPVECAGGTRSVDSTLMGIARRFQSRHIMYASTPLSDCSGMYHRVLSRLEERCDGVLGPEVEVARSAMAIAQWYDERELLVQVRAPEDADPWLAPGTVAFFARRPCRDDAIRGIKHIAIVVDVRRDEYGQVTSYRLFHGRNFGKPASITNVHRRTSDPPFGNGPDHLVALALMAPDRAMEAAETYLTADWDTGSSPLVIGGTW